MRREATVTDQDLQRAWEALRQPDWLPLQQAMHAAAQYKLVYGLALRMANGERPPTASTPERPTPPAGTVRRECHAPPGPPLPHHAAIFDRKRAASGERPDD